MSSEMTDKHTATGRGILDVFHGSGCCDPQTESHTCDFCNADTDSLISIVDAAGDRWDICQDCFYNDDAEWVCAKCGSDKEPYKHDSFMMTCRDCGHTSDMLTFFCLNEHVRRGVEKYNEKMQRVKLAESVIRSAFDKIGGVDYGRVRPRYVQNDLNAIITLAKAMRVDGMSLGETFINQLKEDTL